MNVELDQEYTPAKLVIGTYEFLSEDYNIESISVVNGCYDGSVVGIGAVFSRSISISMSYIEGIVRGTPFYLYFKLKGQWKRIGKFYADDYPAKSGKKMTLEAHGIIEEYGNQELCFPGNKQYYTLKDVKEKVESMLGCSIYFSPTLGTDGTTTFLEKKVCFLKDIEDYVQPREIHTGISVRTALAGIATLFGGNVYEDGISIRIKEKSYDSGTEYVFSRDTYGSEYQYSQFQYAIHSIHLSFLPWSLGMFYPPPSYDRVYTVSYLGDSRVENLLLESGIQGYTLYDFKIECDWIGWTNDVGDFDPYTTPGGKPRGCYRQGDLYYRTGSFSFVGYNDVAIQPGNIIHIEVKDESTPIRLYCGQIELSWDGGFTTTVSCECNIESGTNSHSASGTTQASASATAAEAMMNLQKISFADITFSNVKDSTISGSIFKDGTISGSKFEDGSIEGSKIADSTLTNSKFIKGSLEGSLFKNGTITDSLIEDATITGAKVRDAAIGFEKVDKSFIDNLTANDAYIKKLKVQIADIDDLTANDAIIKNIQAVVMSADYIRSATAELGYMMAEEADMRYASITLGNIDTANIDKANVGLLFNEIGLIDRATIVDGHVTGILDSVEINADKITLGTLVADRILLRGSEQGVLYALNNLGELVSENVDSLDGYVLTERTVNADRLIAKSITANEMDVESIFADFAVLQTIFAQDITATGTISGVTLKGAYAEIDGGSIAGLKIYKNYLAGGLGSSTKGEYSYHFSVGNNPSSDPGFHYSKTYMTENNSGVLKVYGDLSDKQLRWVDSDNDVSFIADKSGVSLGKNVFMTGSVIGGKWKHSDASNYGLYWSATNTLRPTTSSKPNIGTSGYPLNSVYAITLYEGGTSLTNKYQKKIGWVDQAYTMTIGQGDSYVLSATTDWKSSYTCIGYDIMRAWPASTWTGAAVSVVKADLTATWPTIWLTAATTQSYAMIVRFFYIS